MRILLLLLTFLSFRTSQVNANDSCKIILDKQVVFRGEVDKENSVASVKARKFKKADKLTLQYYSENAAKGWNRTIYINDANDTNIKTIELGKQNGSVSVNASVFNKMIEKKEAVFIYTMSLPIDKTMAARVRVRRIFICKIEWN